MIKWKAEASGIREMHQRTYVGPQPVEYGHVELRAGQAFLISDEENGVSKVRNKSDTTTVSTEERTQILRNSRPVRNHD